MGSRWVSNPTISPLFNEMVLNSKYPNEYRDPESINSVAYDNNLAREYDKQKKTKPHIRKKK